MNFTPPPYNADIGPGGPDMNAKTQFSRVHTAMKSKMSPLLGAPIPAGALSQTGDSALPGSSGQPGIGGPRAPGVGVQSQRSQAQRMSDQMLNQAVQEAVRPKVGF